MKNFVFLSLVTLLLFGCGNTKSDKKESTQVNTEEAVKVYTVDELYENASDLTDKEILVKGTVFHVCQQGGERCFIMGSNENINIRIEAGEKIGTFSQELMGSEIEIVGIFKQVKTEAEAHNPGEHSEGETAGDKETEMAHQLITDSEEAAEVVYFIEGLKSKEL